MLIKNSEIALEEFGGCSVRMLTRSLLRNRTGRNWRAFRAYNDIVSYEIRLGQVRVLSTGQGPRTAFAKFA